MFGRDADADRVGRYQAPVLILTGDSGIGKSTVLRLACAQRAGWVYAEPRTLQNSTGSLFDAFLESLAQALAKLVEAGISGDTLAQRLVEAARRLLDQRLDVLGRVALAELVALVRTRVGDDAGKATARLARDIWPDDALSAAGKILKARDPGRGEVLARFAEAACEIAPDVRLALSFDEGEALSEEDVRLLRDLAAMVSSRVHLRVAHATDGPERKQTVDALVLLKEIDEIEVGPLSHEAVEEWLRSEGVAERDHVRLMEQTAGYPLFLETAVAYVRAGGAITDIPRDQQIAARTRPSWNALSPRAKSVARSLSVLHYPLEETNLRRLARVEGVGDWATVVEELQLSRIFSVEVNGQPWFHAQRRAFVLHDCLSPAQPSEAAAAAAELVWENLALFDFAGLVTYAELVGLSSQLQREQPNLGAVMGLSDAALAVAASLLELATDKMIVDADSLFGHALRFIERIDDPAAVLAELDSASLVGTRTFGNGSDVIIGARWDAFTGALITGRAWLKFGKQAVPQLATLAFDLAVRERLGAITEAQYGIGNLTIGGLARVAGGAQPSAGYVNRRQPACNLLLLGLLLGDVSFYCVARYANDDDRAEAEDALRGLVAETAIGEVRLTAVERHPVEPVPSELFTSALFRATGERSTISDEIDLPAPEGVGDADLAERRIATARLLRAHSSELEEITLELDRGYVLAWNAGADFWDECVVRIDGADEQRHVPSLEASLVDPYEAVRARQALALKPQDQYRGRFTRWREESRREPIAAEVSYRRRLSGMFNSAQRMLAVNVDERYLQPLLEDAFRRELEVARAMWRELPLHRRVDELAPRALWVLAALDPDQAIGGRLWGVHGARSIELPSDKGEDYVRLKITDGRGGEELNRDDPFFDEFDAAWRTRAGQRASSHLSTLIARVLGYRDSDIDLLWNPAQVPSSR